jgi:histidinol-phosphate aminotransferase
LPNFADIGHQNTHQMAHINRRQWLRHAGIGGAFSLLGGFRALAQPTQPEWLPREQPTRLSSNENPLGPSVRVREAIQRSLDQAYLYPNAFAAALQEKIARREGLSSEHIVLTGGSTEGLKTAGLAYGWQGGEIVAADPTFHVLMEYAAQFGVYVHRVPVRADLGHDLEAMERRITQQTRLVFVCNPDNPTGTLLSAERLRDFCGSISRRTVVFADEAYFDYIDQSGYPSMTELVKADMNVIVSRTFSKIYGLAGLRIGYLVARPDIAARLRRHVMAGLSIPAIFAAEEALEDKAFYEYSLQQNASAKKMIYETLDALKLSYVPSQANFVFFQAGRPVDELNRAMAAQGVIMGRPFPPLLQWSRVSTGTVADMKHFAQAIRAVYST